MVEVGADKTDIPSPNLNSNTGDRTGFYPLSFPIASQVIGHGLLERKFRYDGITILSIMKIHRFCKEPVIHATKCRQVAG